MSGALYGGDDVGAIVVDIGSHTTKVGFAGADVPHCVLPSYVSRTKVETAMDQTDDSSAPKEEFQYAVGTTTLGVPKENREIVPLLDDNGLVADWKALEHLLRHAFDRVLQVKPEEKCVMVSEPTWVTKDQRDKMTELLFETFNVRALHYVKSPVLSAFANGRGTALVVDSGAQFTSVTPVYDGVALLEAARRTRCAGNFVTRQLKHVLEEDLNLDLVPSCKIASKTPVAEDVLPIWKPKANFPTLTASAEEYYKNEIIRDLQASVCRVSDKPFVESQLNNIPTTPYEFPNGYNNNWGIERYKIVEGFFNPDKFRYTAPFEGSGPTIDPLDPRSITDPNSAPMYVSCISVNPQLVAVLLSSIKCSSSLQPRVVREVGIAQIIDQVLRACDVETHQSLLSTVVVCGSNSLYQGFEERVHTEIGKITPRAFKFKIVASQSSQERMYSAWIGGSIYASLGTFQQLWVTREAWRDDKDVIEMRCS
ncbi:uncharacterized protein MONBRDRAFT_33661 [Monosiga brevicollis MX1]|uniref:Actin-related protein 4 n=1 Tax=Monosiga brevicollis TaxID=81824 RepID=A9V6F1_MONBE|nr:uncharacterized protein MONBRDRAFT_33661 [Monosiga brevicollis MX1]EDQ86871.1 predicted protein [Monosiga brevicollis MX1]|eukprot:XP_001748416.1 hypothetical protein [Monosiga brevicollis MX1]